MKKVLLLSFLIISVFFSIPAKAQYRMVSGVNDNQFDKNKETFIVLRGYYGTSMAKATIDLSLTAPEIITATVTWHVSPPPVTPDTTTCQFVFAVNKTVIDKIKVVVVIDQMDRAGGSNKTEINRIDVSVDPNQEKILVDLNAEKKL